jgi:hypothetical protein
MAKRNLNADALQRKLESRKKKQRKQLEKKRRGWKLLRKLRLRSELERARS